MLMLMAVLLVTPPPQVLKKEGQEFAPRSYWDVVRRGASQALFSDLAEVYLSSVPIRVLVHVRRHPPQL